MGRCGLPDARTQYPGAGGQLQRRAGKRGRLRRGAKAPGYGEGNYKSEGKISLLRDDYDELLDYCKRRGISLYKLVIPKIAVSYANPGSRTRTDILSTVTFTKTDQKAAQGDKSLKVDIDFIIVNGITRDGVRAI